MKLDDPLRFEPIFRRYLWGGRRLETVLNKPLAPGSDYAESWEIVDHGPEQSIVSSGPVAGKTLHELVTQHAEELLGKHSPQDSFPLLFKYLDCNRNLSIQVHPNDAQAATLNPPDLGKTEAWVVIAANPGSVIYAGLQQGVDRKTLEREIAKGTTEQCLHCIEPQVGDCIFVPAGVVHALGEGVVVAEIQQASDTTFRLFDWNRVGTDKKPRPLHIQQALEVIDYEHGPLQPAAAKQTSQPDVERLVECQKFILDRWHLTSSLSLAGDNRFHIIAVIQGSIELSGQTVTLGQTLLIPACLGPLSVKPVSEKTVLLDMFLP